MAVLAVLAQTAPAARQDTMKPQLVTTIQDKKLGVVLTTAGKQAIYVWNSRAQGRGSLHRRVREGLATRHRQGRCGRADARQGDHGGVWHCPPRRRRTSADFSTAAPSTPTRTRRQARCCATTSTAGSRSRCTGEAGNAPRDTGRDARLRAPHVSRRHRHRAVVAAVGKARMARVSGRRSRFRARCRPGSSRPGLAHLHGRGVDAAVRPGDVAAARRRARRAAAGADLRRAAPLPRAEQVSTSTASPAGR